MTELLFTLSDFMQLVAIPFVVELLTSTVGVLFLGFSAFVVVIRLLARILHIN